MSYKTTVKVESLHEIFPLHFALKMKNVQHIDDKCAAHCITADDIPNLFAESH